MRAEPDVTGTDAVTLPPAPPQPGEESGRSAAPGQSALPRGSWLVWALVAASFACYATLRFPIPAVNEPHYLCKARHYWNPNWCTRDLFLQSANAHVVFYQTVGAAAAWFSFESAAWIGRSAGWALLAWGWTALVCRLIPHRWSPLWSAWIFLALQAYGSFSGEWIVGGVEAKVFSYGWAFLALAWLLDFRWNRSAAAAGLAVSFHPVVGIWTCCALLPAGLMQYWRSHHSRWATIAADVDRPAAVATHTEMGALVAASRTPARESTLHKLTTLAAWQSWWEWRGQSDHRHWGSIVSALALLGLCAAPGLVPALQLLGGTTPEAAAYADELQVFSRLKHHLDPASFPARAFWEYGALIVFWLAFRRMARWTMAEPAFLVFAGTTLLIAAAGLYVGFGPRSASLLKFYPFRLADVMVPVAAAFTLTGLAWRLVETRPFANCLSWGVFATLFAVTLTIPAVDRDPTRLPTAKRADWVEACRWVAAETPPDALCWVAQSGWGFKWYAERAEYVAYKDCPQDPHSLVEWNQRLWNVHGWQQSHVRGYSAANLHELHTLTGIDFVISSKPGLFSTEPVFRNPTFAVYKINGELVSEIVEVPDSPVGE